MNLVHFHGYRAVAAMSGTPHNAAWTADKAIDGNTSQSYLSNSCAISNIYTDKLKSSYLKMWFKPSTINIAYIEIYFRSESK